MSRKIISIFLSTLLIATFLSAIVIADSNGNIMTLEDPNSSEIQPDTPNFALWDVQFQYDVGGDSGSAYLVGVGFDGTYFYCPEFNSANIHQFDSTGSYLGTVSVPGVANLVDMTYDGTYMYSVSTAGYTIYQMDMTTLTLVGTISIPTASYNIAYDGDNDGFWVGQWDSHLTLVDRSGSVLDSMTPPESMLGMAWDNTSETTGYNGPFLWIFTGTSTGLQGIIKQIDLDTKTITGVEHNVALDLGMGIAGGLFLTTDYLDGYLTLMGMIQGADPVDDYIFGYEICEIGPSPQNVMVTALETGWNLVSLPFNTSVDKINITVNYLGTNYTWADAVTAGYLNQYVFGWDRLGQSYVFSDTFIPGEGYWVYSTVACELWEENITIIPDALITGLKTGWNLMGVPSILNVNKTDLICGYGGSDYNWSDAVTAGYVNQYVFGWDRIGQSYVFSDTLIPGDGYWMYATVDCLLKQ